MVIVNFTITKILMILPSSTLGFLLLLIIKNGVFKARKTQA